jgi:hypothetical protein
MGIRLNNPYWQDEMERLEYERDSFEEDAYRNEDRYKCLVSAIEDILSEVATEHRAHLEKALEEAERA